MKQRWTLRKTSIGVCSVLLGFMAFQGRVAADSPAMPQTVDDLVEEYTIKDGGDELTEAEKAVVEKLQAEKASETYTQSDDRMEVSAAKPTEKVEWGSMIGNDDDITPVSLKDEKN